jgi:hypothetical protein
MISPSRLTVTGADLEIFFECEPSKLDRDVPWPYNKFTFAYERGEESIEFKIHPAEPSVEIKVTRAKQTTYELKAFGIVDAVYHNDNGQESLELTLSQHHQIFLRLKPSVVVYEAFSTFV